MHTEKLTHEVNNRIQIPVPDDYYRRSRPELLALIPRNARKVLDVGCGEGAMAMNIKKISGVEEVIGIEKNESAAKIAMQHLDRVIIGDLEQLTLQFPNGYFDCIICADVLEHFSDPWSALTRLRPLLAEDGILFASIPNIRNLVPLIKILINRWEYEEEGLLDRTHLRFFTLHTMKKMFLETGYTVQVVGTNSYRDWKFRLIQICTLGFMNSFAIFQYFIYARKDKNFTV